MAKKGTGKVMKKTPKRALCIGIREYSYDAYIEGAYHGAMTYYAVQAIKQANYKLTYSQLHQRLVNLITDYPQQPQPEGKNANKKRQIFS